MRFALLTVLLTSMFVAGCARQVRREEEARPPRVTVEEATRLIPAKVPDAEGWAYDVLRALDARELHPDAEAVCSVLAVIEQESNFKANPEVPNLPRIVDQKLEAYADKLGPLGRPALEKLLGGRAEGSKLTFAQRLKKVRTERDLDVVFRDLLRYYETEYPATFSLLGFASAVTGRGNLEALNPITTAGSMQVSVLYALEVANEDADDDVDEWSVRDRLYSREGGVYFGVARLLGFEASYDDPLYRFADYNAGFYASRNAAVQEQVAALTGRKLALDGDLLAYDKHGEPVAEDSSSLKALLAFRERYAPWISERQLRREVRQEKRQDFEDTDTWRALKASYEKVKQARPAYARLPDVTLHSPKLSRGRTTAWFARSVDQRYQRCRKAIGR